MPLKRITATAAASVALLGLAFAADWQADPAQSKVAFIGTQAGAEFEGVFERYNAEIAFDPKDLAHSEIDVTIDTRSVNTKDKERDGILRGPNIFATDRWPTAHYVADKFVDEGYGKFMAQGALTLRDVTRPVPVEFNYRTDANGAVLTGGAKLKRLDFGVGQGEWKDTSWVGNDVRVEFSLRLVPAKQ